MMKNGAIDELRQLLLYVWRGFEQSLIDGVVDQWLTRLRDVFVTMMDIVDREKLYIYKSLFTNKW